MNLVDDVDFEMASTWGVTNVVAQLSHLFDTVIAGAVDFEDVETVAVGDLLATITFAAGRHRRAMNAIERLGQDARGRGFSDPAWAHEQVRVRESILFDSVLQRSSDVRLPDEVVECLRAIFASKNLITHRRNLTR